MKPAMSTEQIPIPFVFVFKCLLTKFFFKNKSITSDKACTTRKSDDFPNLDWSEFRILSNCDFEKEQWQSDQKEHNNKRKNKCASN